MKQPGARVYTAAPSMHCSWPAGRLSVLCSTSLCKGVSSKLHQQMPVPCTRTQHSRRAVSGPAHACWRKAHTVLPHDAAANISKRDLKTLVSPALHLREDMCAIEGHRQRRWVQELRSQESAASRKAELVRKYGLGNARPQLVQQQAVLTDDGKSTAGHPCCAAPHRLRDLARGQGLATPKGQTQPLSAQEQASRRSIPSWLIPQPAS